MSRRNKRTQSAPSQKASLLSPYLPCVAFQFATREGGMDPRYLTRQGWMNAAMKQFEMDKMPVAVHRLTLRSYQDSVTGHQLCRHSNNFFERRSGRGF